MLKQDLLAQDQFLEEQEQTQNGTQASPKQSRWTEEMKWLCGIVQQEFDADQIEQDLSGSGKTIVRFPVLARDIADGDFSNGRSGPTGQGRYEPM
jgi:hypothetical protein